MAAIVSHFTPKLQMTSTDAYRYMAKFDSAAKLPKGARLYGYGGLDDVGKMAVSQAGLPRWLLFHLPAGHPARRFPGGGWVDTVTGEIYRSPYIWTPRGAVLRAGSVLVE